MKQRSLLLGSFFLFLMSTALSQHQDVSSRAYMGITGGNLLFAGSFDGSSFFRTDDDIVLVPKIQPAYGLGGVVGIMLNNGAIDVGYTYYTSEYTNMESGYTGECAIHLIRFFGLTKYFNNNIKGRINPFIDFEMSMVRSVFKKIAYPIGWDTLPNSANFGAIAIGLGVGARIWITGDLALDLRILAEYSMGTSIRVKNRDWYDISKFGNLLVQSTLGIIYYFKPT